jgi:hypothetical protein
MKLTLLSLLIAISCIANAQRPATANIRGSVAEETKSPVEGASIGLIRNQDTAAYKMSETDKSGRFIFETIPVGKYHLVVTAVGHESFSGPAFSVSTDNKNIDLPQVVLKKKTNELQSVAVVANKSFRTKGRPDRGECGCIAR